MSNIYLKVAIETLSRLRFFGFKKLVTRSVFGELQLTHLSLNFGTSCCNRKWKIPHTVLERRTLSFSSCKNDKLNCDELEFAKEKGDNFLYRLFCSKGIFF